MNSNPPSIIIDCNYLCYVSRFAMSDGLTYRGSNTEIIFGFLRQILTIAERFEPDRFFFCWDSRESIRKEMFPSYKGNRRPDSRPEEEKELDFVAFKQFDEIREQVLPNMGFRNNYQVDGYEGDDLIAVLVKKLSPPIVVAASDNDLFQLLSFCSLYNVSKKSLTTEQEFKRTYGICPEQWVDVKSLAGCPGDNVPGIPGVGTKTAIRYIKGELTKGKAFDSIASAAGLRDLNRSLVALPLNDIPLPIYKVDNLISTSVQEVLRDYGLASLLKEPTWSKWVKLFHLQ